ncbi:MAG: OsmC family protein [Prevotella sp.]|jgi:putative redox protein
MNIAEAKHLGHNRIALTYANTDVTYTTDIPTSHGGLEEYPSPTALMAEALAACALTTACLWSTNHDIDHSKFHATVENMEIDPTANAVSDITIRFHFNRNIAAELRPRIEAATRRGCTVGNTLTTNKHFIFDYDI